MSDPPSRLVLDDVPWYVDRELRIRGLTLVARGNIINHHDGTFTLTLWKVRFARTGAVVGFRGTCCERDGYFVLKGFVDRCETCLKVN